MMSPIDIDIEEHNDNVPEIMKNLIKQGKASFESVHITKDKRKIPVEINSHVFELIGEPVVLSIARDITNRLHYEKELKNSEEKYRRLISFLPDAIFIINNKEDIVFANNTAVRLLEFNNAEELLRLKYLDIVHHDSS